MATEQQIYPERLHLENVESTSALVKKMVMVSALFAIVEYLLILETLFLELTQFHPLLEDFFASHIQLSLTGGGPDRAGQTAVNSQL